MITDPKVCSKCAETKSASQDYYVKDKKSGRLFTWCKLCQNEKSRASFAKRYADNPEPIKAQSRAYSASHKQERSANRKAKRLADVEGSREAGRRYEATPKCRAARKAYRESNAEHRKRYDSEYRRKKRPQVNAANAEYRRLHPEIYREASRRWQAANPLKSAAIRRICRHRRRAILAAAEGSFTEAEWMAIKERQGYTCPMCGLREPFITLTVDHVIPISKGGSNYADNLQGLCGWCNSVKKDRIIDVRSYFRSRPKPRRKPARRFA